MTGRCLCGAVRFAFEAKKHDVEVCHCGMCRRWTGGPQLGLAHDGAVSFEGAEHIGVYASSDWAERTFCKVCGTSLYWRIRGTDEYSFCAGTLDDESGLELSTEIFIDEKPAYYAFANETKKLTAKEAMATFIPADKRSNTDDD
jgi:hypothetical protein